MNWDSFGIPVVFHKRAVRCLPHFEAQIAFCPPDKQQLKNFFECVGQAKNSNRAQQMAGSGPKVRHVTQSIDGKATVGYAR